MATIDEQIVKLKMDNADFKTKVASSIDSLGTLKSSLNLDGATNSLQKLANTAKTVTFDKVGISQHPSGKVLDDVGCCWRSHWYSCVEGDFGRHEYVEGSDH